MPQWKWFVDYATVGNRIWLAWDDNFIDVDVLSLGPQLIHARAMLRSLHELVMITIIYGANEVADRRDLWVSLEALALNCVDIPWMVGRDFNAGEWFTWNNCSASPRNLWKRLDRILINDSWVMRFPSLSYSCLTPRTSDHSPMVIAGDAQRQFGAETLKPIFRAMRREKGDLSHNVQLAKGFLDMAQQLVSLNRHEELYLFLEHCCRLVYAKAAKMEQNMLQQRAKMQWMKEEDQCTCVFFRKIAHRRAVKRVIQINDAHGTTHTDLNVVSEEFVSYFQALLGGNRRREVLNLRFLRPWAQHIVEEDETVQLIKPFTAEDVKRAMFNIAEDKAPGPDGHRAILDFFNTGKLLKQVNCTLLAVIPKVHSPITVADFRPSSCCNVLYKVIVKFLVQRLSVVLGKLVSPCQVAFIPGRSIGDNIMIAQELFTGYKQKRLPPRCAQELFTGYKQKCLPPRCALKVDIRKAYDTVDELEWKTPRFFYGFARAAPRRSSLTISLCPSHGSFADDVLLFSRAKVDSVRMFKDGLERFGDWSRLRLNAQKSHLILSRAAQGLKEELLTMLQFQEGQLPMRYLGLPLISSRLLISDCLPLLNKIEARIAGWERLALSYAGRVQIIKSVLSSHSIYWASAFILPKRVINEIEKRLWKFLWKGTGSSRYAKVAWKEVCKAKDDGGQGLKDIGILNRALMCKKLCDVIRCNRTSIWVDWLHQGRLQDASIWTISDNRGSWGWRKLIRLRQWLRSEVVYRIGDGEDFYLWRDPWSCGLSFTRILHALPIIHGGNDRIMQRFPGNAITTQTLYHLFDPPGPKVGWSLLLSGPLKIPRHMFILWLAIQEKLATTDKQWLSHLEGCVLCNEDDLETHTHLFFQCHYSRRCLTAIRQTIRFLWPNKEWKLDIEWASRKWRGKHIINMTLLALLGSYVYHIWRERNLRRFKHTARTPVTLTSLIIEDVRLQILSINLPNSVSTSALYRLWRIHWPIEREHSL
ncbi:UNVERIFIED_CONTAM: hypothetical protein Sindi_2464800 [Sesamum indicum]